MYKVHIREGKLDQMLEPYYRIVEQTDSVSFVIWDQMSRKVERFNDLKRKKDEKVTHEEPEEMESDSASENEERCIMSNQ